MGLVQNMVRLELPQVEASTEMKAVNMDTRIMPYSPVEMGPLMLGVKLETGAY